MLISYSRPADIVWGLEGTGAAFLTSSDRLTNGRPSSGTRIQWLSGSQTTSSLLELQGYFDYSAARVNTFAALIGVTLPVGTKIVCVFRFDLTVYSVETRVVERYDGTRVAVFYFDPAVTTVATDSVSFQIWNDVNGVASIAADSDFEIGEAWFGQSSRWKIRNDVELNMSDLSKDVVSIGGQPFPVRRRAIRQTQFSVTPMNYTDTFNASASIDDLRERLLGLQPAIIVPMTAEPFTGATAVDADYVNRHAQFGYFSKLGPIVGSAPLFVFSGAFNAPPALLP